MSEWDLERPKVLHVSMGRRCNNRCTFCMEYGEGLPERFDLAQIQAQLQRIRAVTPAVVFTSGEPTLNPLLPGAVAAARDHGYTLIGLITNGRRLASRELSQRLLEAGLNEVTVSLHGPTTEVHDAITGRPGSFAEAVAGLEILAELRGEHPHALRMNCTLVRANLASMADLYRLARRFGVDSLNFNAVEPRGRAADDFDEVVPRYAEILAAADDSGLDFQADGVALSRVPPCAGGPAWIQEEFHLPHDDEISVFDPAEGMIWGPPCEGCLLHPRCEGVPDNYVAVFGWDELEPVRPERAGEPPLAITLDGAPPREVGRQLRRGMLAGHRQVRFTVTPPAGGDALGPPVKLARGLGYRQVEAAPDAKQLGSSAALSALLSLRLDGVILRFASVDPATHDAATGRPGSYAHLLRAAKQLSAGGVALTLRFRPGPKDPAEADTARRLGQVLGAEIERD